MKAILITLFLSVMSCEKWKVDEISIDSPLVLNAQISSEDSLLTVYFGQVADLSNANLKPGDLAIEDALVSLLSSEEEIKLEFNKALERYQIETQNISLHPGSKFRLQADHKGQTVHADFSIPKVPDDLQLTVERKDNAITGTVIWTSPQSQMVYIPTIYSVVTSGGLQSQSFGTWDFDQTSILSSRMDNEQFEVKYSISNVSSNPDIVLEMVVLEETGLRYLESIRNSNDTPQLSQEFLDRFISPSLRYSNVENGLGIVLGYRRVTLSQKL